MHTGSFAHNITEGGFAMNKNRKIEMPMYSDGGRIAVFTEIIQRCGACIGRIDDPKIEKELAKTARVLSEVLVKEFSEKEKDE